jgi:excisionase family DNA binding protein
MEMPGQVGGKVRQDDRDAELAYRAARRIGEYLTTHPGASPVTIQGELAGDDALVVPREAAVLLAQVLGYLANGEGVTVMPDSAELTTQQAAEFLNVSRPYLIKLVETGEIPFRLVGTHRRVRFRDLREYKNRDDLQRRRAADELTQLSEELGLYWPMTFTVVYDANVLYPNTLRDLLIRIAQPPLGGRWRGRRVFCRVG